MRTILIVAACLAAHPAAAWGGAFQEQAAAVPADSPAVVQPPEAFQVAGRARLVLDSAAQAQRQVRRLREDGVFRNELAEARSRFAELQLLQATLLETDYIRPERVSRVRDQIVLEDQRLDGLRGRISERVQQLGAVRGEWMQRQRAWREWRELLRTDPDFGLAATDLNSTIAAADSVVAAAGAAMTELIEIQRAVDAMRVEFEAAGQALAAARAERRAALFQRGEPVLLSPRHIGQLRAEDASAWVPVAALQPAAYLYFARNHAGLLAFHVLMILLVAAAASRLRRYAGPGEAWGGLLAHPWALGVMASTIVAMQRVTLAPPLWDVGIWTLFAGSAAVLARPLFPTRALRLTLWLFALFYPLFLFLEVAGLATPVFRLVIAGVAAAALPVFAMHARRRTAAAAEEESSDPWRIWPLRVGAIMWGIVLVAIIFGFDLFGRWVLHAAVTSAAVVFVVVLLLTLTGGMIAALLRTEAQGRFLRSIAVPFAKRLVAFFQAVFGFAALLVIADVWELAPSPVATWQLLVGAGFDVAGIRITVGRLLVAAFVLYMSLVLSWLVRSFLQSESYRKWNFDRGVGDSINMLVHYTFIVIGVLLALGVLGVQLQNFAIIAGALGIGIGFGLQNVVNSFASGLILLFERPVRVGDTVIVGGEWGTIRKIGLRSTVMLTFDQSEMIVPNADLVSEKVVNWTLSNPIARVILEVGTAYGSDIGQVLQILRESGTAHEGVLPEPPPQALFVGFGDSSLDFELRVWVREIRLRLEVRSVILTEIERRFAEAGIEIPFPQRDLHIRSVDGPAADRLLGR